MIVLRVKAFEADGTFIEERTVHYGQRLAFIFHPPASNEPVVSHITVERIEVEELVLAS